MAVETSPNKARVDVAAPRIPHTSDIAGTMGHTSISDDVVSKIAGIAAREVEGVHQLVTTGAMATLSGFAQRIARADQRGQGVVVEVGQKEAAVDLALEIEYGVEIRRVCEGVRRNVIARIESMTGLHVKEVNILVADLYFPDEVSAPSRRVE